MPVFSLRRWSRAPLEAEPDRAALAQQSDARLVLLAAEGYLEAWEVIWDRYAPLVRRRLLGCLGPDEAIDDLTQETFLALYRTLDRLRDPGALRGYLVGTAVRLAVFERRTRARRTRRIRLTSTGHLPEPPVEDAHGERDALRSLRRVLEKLGPDELSAFVLRYVEGLSPPDVAVSLGVSESTAKRLAARARDRVLLLAGRDAALASFVTAQNEEAQS